MTGPFPGMNPYLENPLWWPGVHSQLIPYIADTLNTVLPAGYVANIEERIVEQSSDLALIVEALPITPRETYIIIQTIGDAYRVVTTLEVLSPDNKTPGEGQRLYLRKQRKLWRARHT